MSIDCKSQEPAFAVRPFQATLAGHASVDVGDEMEVINDTHWYWWLVRVLRTSSIGYIPAEFLELPNERLARQNRDRNASIPEAGMLPSKQPTCVAVIKKRVRFANRDPDDAEFFDCSDTPPELVQDTSDISDSCDSPLRD